MNVESVESKNLDSKTLAESLSDVTV